MEVRAKQDCFHNGRRRKGDTFDFEGEKVPDWMEKVQAAKADLKPKPRVTDK